jgi:hypothetical protein
MRIFPFEPDNFDNDKLYAPGLAPAKSHVLLTDR